MPLLWVRIQKSPINFSDSTPLGATNPSEMAKFCICGRDSSVGLGLVVNIADIVSDALPFFLKPFDPLDQQAQAIIG